MNTDKHLVFAECRSHWKCNQGRAFVMQGNRNYLMKRQNDAQNRQFSSVFQTLDNLVSWQQMSFWPPLETLFCCPVWHSHIKSNSHHYFYFSVWLSLPLSLYLFPNDGSKRNVFNEARTYDTKETNNINSAKTVFLGPQMGMEVSNHCKQKVCLNSAPNQIKYGLKSLIDNCKVILIANKPKFLLKGGNLVFSSLLPSQPILMTWKRANAHADGNNATIY